MIHVAPFRYPRTQADLECFQRERRHFPHIDNSASVPKYRSSGRRYIPHGYGFDDGWAPHPQNIQVKYSENGPDWKSKLKYIPDPDHPEYPAAEIFPNNWKAMRPYPFTYKRSSNEWLLDPGLTKVGLRCSFDGVHKATNVSSNEITHKMLFGRGRNETIIDKRNGIPYASEGDKTYQAVEYSPGFHRTGSSRPLPEFGSNFKRPTADTFVPLQRLPAIPRDNYRHNERRLQRDDDIASVRGLDSWKPATPLHMTLPQEEKK
ncbi:spermatogenesis-associated serine-rich protein 1-like isoform X2 [Mizuhopecten yessoensis]|nr:spermatogenesis-associated serine-rich protein 1-like isoform X2 [Mizuhopecten yessoensis]